MTPKYNLLDSTFSNPVCYARELGNCSQRKSGEHFISKSLLEKIEKSGKLNIQGPAWLSENEERIIPIKSMKANVLCKRHNSDLSGLDSAGTEFCSYLLNVKIKQAQLTVDGQEIERWLLKVLCGFGTSGYLNRFNGWTPKREWLDILFFDKTLPDEAGLYYLISNKVLEAGPNEFGIWPVVSDEKKEIIGLHLLLSGYTFLFLMGEFSNPHLEHHVQNGFRPVFRPNSFQITYGDHVNQLYLGGNSGETIFVNVSNSL